MKSYLLPEKCYIKVLMDGWMHTNTLQCSGFKSNINLSFYPTFTQLWNKKTTAGFSTKKKKMLTVDS